MIGFAFEAVRAYRWWFFRWVKKKDGVGKRWTNYQNWSRKLWLNPNLVESRSTPTQYLSLNSNQLPTIKPPRCATVIPRDTSKAPLGRSRSLSSRKGRQERIGHSLTARLSMTTNAKPRFLTHQSTILLHTSTTETHTWAPIWLLGRASAELYCTCTTQNGTVRGGAEYKPGQIHTIQYKDARKHPIATAEGPLSTPVHVVPCSKYLLIHPL